MSLRTPTLIPVQLVAAALAAAFSAAGASAQTGAKASANPPGLDCMIQPHLVVQVGTAAPGVIQTVRVDRGDLVRKGQPVVLMKSDVERAALAVARERASQVGELKSARGATDLAEREAQRAAQLVDENFVSRTYFDRQRAEVQVAAGRGEQAQERIRLAQREVDLAAAQLSQRTVVSPIDGVVVERFVAPGEYVEQKPVLRIAAVDPLRVDVLVPAAQFGRVAVGSRAQVVPDLLDRRAHTATVTSVDRVVDAASNTFRVRLELPNPGGALPPGLRCKADLAMAGAPSTTPAAAPSPVPAGPGAAVPAPAAAPAAPAAAPAVSGRTGPTQLATQAQVRRTEPVEPAVARAPEPARVNSVTRQALIQGSPTTPRLKMADIEWPTAVATVTPGR
jgi:membrane fusion protein, heavy metal efflux system